MARTSEITIIEPVTFGIRNTVRLIGRQSDLYSACLIAERHFRSMDCTLLATSIGDVSDSSVVVRPFGTMPDYLKELAAALRDGGGCPIRKEAVRRRLCPFSVSSIDRASLKSFMETRFLDELHRLGNIDIFVVPVLLSRSLTIFTVGINDPELAGDKVPIITAVCQIAPALISRFPEINTMFAPRRLSALEAETLIYATNGHTDEEIGQFLDLGAGCVARILDTAARKTGSNTREQLVARALALGEISNLQYVDSCGD